MKQNKALENLTNDHIFLLKVRNFKQKPDSFRSFRTFLGNSGLWTPHSRDSRGAYPQIRMRSGIMEFLTFSGLSASLLIRLTLFISSMVRLFPCLALSCLRCGCVQNKALHIFHATQLTKGIDCALYHRNRATASAHSAPKSWVTQLLYVIYS